MDNLDFSALSDDQLIGLLRAILQEAVARHPAVVAAVRAAVLDEQEKASIAKEAAEREAARLRALERERVAKEAAERVRAAKEAEDKLAREAAIRREGEAAAAKAAEREAKLRQILVRAGELVGLAPAAINVIVLDGYRGKRVLVNEGADRYTRKHLVDYAGPTNISTARHLVGAKKDLIVFCAELAAAWNKLCVIGEEFSWENTA